LTIVAPTVLGVTDRILLSDILAGIAVGAGTAVVFRFALRTIITRK